MPAGDCDNACRRLSPLSVRRAIVGNSGNKALRAFQAAGHRVIPVNPHEREVEGIRSYRSVLDVPDVIDVATVYVQPEVALQLLPEFDKKAIPEIWINPGAESAELLAEASAGS